MNNYTVAETFKLPSRGLIYDKPINPEVRLRSMTTEDEMRRLSPTDTPYKSMSEIIERCMVDKPEIHVYDMCLGDYQYLLHRLRVVTYGPDYKMAVRCPICGNVSSMVANLDLIEVYEYDDETFDSREIELPVTKKKVRINYQTPRMLDNINARAKEIIKKNPDVVGDPSYLLTIKALINSVDGVVLNEAKLESFIRTLPMRDTNTLIQFADKLNRKVGLDNEIHCHCSQCNNDIDTTFRITSEFFGPTID